MAIGRPIPPLHLSSDERESLERWKRRPTTAQALALRSRIILRCSEGKTNTVVAGEIGLAKQTVGKWRARFIERRLDGLLDEPRPGGPRSITDTDVERVVTLTLETTPADATHWSTRSMAARTGLSQSAISRIWRAFALQPHRTETFKLSSDRSCSSRRSVTPRSSGARSDLDISTHPSGLWSCVSTRSPRSRPSTGRPRCCPCARGRSSAGPMTTVVMVRPLSSPPST